MFIVITIVLFAVSFLLALRSLRHELERENRKGLSAHELKRGESLFIKRN